MNIPSKFLEKKIFCNNLFKLVVIPTLLAMVILSGCAAAPAAPVNEAEPTAAAAPIVTQAELEAQARETVFAWEDAYQAGDLDRLMEVYTDDVVSMPPNRPVIEGKEALEEDFRQFYAEFTVERQFTLVDLELAGDTAFRRGEWTQTFTPKAGGEPITEVGKCLLVLKRFDDEWKIETEIWNTDSVIVGESQ